MSSSAQGTRGRAAPMSAEDRREAILDAVLPLLQQAGSAVSTRRIAQAAGIAEGTIFRVFRDKEELMAAAFGRAARADQVADQIEAIPIDSPAQATPELLERRVTAMV
ncbi:MAG: TetR/AcrR family transcriptional regulator, partial [Bifidobacteriaceae bacterium]|nr:TetR/AcrR family transcriptional regulator [Bifidobacteriaceae bacterium]